MKFTKTTKYIAKTLSIFGGHIEIIWIYSDEYTKDEALQLRDELKAEGLFYEKLRRYNRE